MDTIILIAITIAVLIIWLIIKYAAPSYIKEKFKNVATKEDIGEITKKIEAVKSEFEKEKIKFSWFHQKQVEVIVEFYSMLRVSIDKIANFTSHVNYESEEFFNGLKVETWDQIKYTHEYYNKKAIFFDKSLQEQVNKLFDTFKDSYAKYDYAQLHLGGSTDKTQVVFEAFQKIDDE